MSNDRHRGQIKSRARVRDLAEVYTHKREVDDMLDLVPDMFPIEADPRNIDRKFLEPACGSGNFLEEILRRKLKHVTVRRYGRGERYEFWVLRALASIYAIDIMADNVDESRDRLRAVINSHMDNDRNTTKSSEGFADAVEVILSTNIIRADSLADAESIAFIDYHPSSGGAFVREWSKPLAAAREPDLFTEIETRKDEIPVHYAELATSPSPTNAGKATADSARRDAW